MKQLHYSELRDANSLSLTLDLALKALRNSPIGLPAVRVSAVLQLHNSDLGRMRRLYLRPHYAPFVCQSVMYKVLGYLFDQFPTLTLLRSANGILEVRLYKWRSGQRLRWNGQLTPPPRPLRARSR